MAIDLPASEAERAARGLIEQASTALAKRRRDIPATFIAQLYARSVPEDMVRYGAEDIAALAERAYDFIAEREPGRPKIRCETVPLSASGNRKTISVLEIVNDDMPFLVDSVMGEIADRRLDVWLVAHPVLGVRRIGNKLAALGSPDPGEGKRESFIHIHLVPIADDTQCDVLVRALQTVLGEVQLAVHDWRPMLDRVTAIATELKSNPPPLPRLPKRFSSCSGFSPTISPSSVCVTTGSTGRCSNPILTAPSESCAHANCTCSSAAKSFWKSRRKSWRF